MHPDYPTFKPIAPEDHALLTDHLALAPRTVCDLSLANLHIWQDCEAAYFTFINENLCILIEPHSEPHYFLEPLSCNKLVETVEICLQHAGRISRATELFTSKLPEDRFRAVALRDHFDYVYETRKLAELKGKKFDGKRNQVKKFVRSHPECEFRTLALLHLEQALELFDRWLMVRNEDPGTDRSLSSYNYRCQGRALRRAFDNYVRLDLIGGALFVEGSMEGFIVGSRGDDQTAVVHFQYANSALPGAYQVLLWEACRSIFSSCAYLNLEEDLGLPGLRRGKMSYQPLRLEKKFLITRR